MDGIITTGFLVKCCGCTDCFPDAIFFNAEQATEYAERECCNPEGWHVEMIDVRSLGLRDD